MSVFSKLSNHDLLVVIQCMNFILNSGHYWTEEIHSRIGVEREEMLAVFEWLQHLRNGEISTDEMVNRSGISKDNICLVIHNSLVDLAYGEVYYDDELKLPYGISRNDINETFERWHAIQGSSL